MNTELYGVAELSESDLLLIDGGVISLFAVGCILMFATGLATTLCII